MGFFERIGNLDRRWIFLLMGLAVAIPIIIIDITGFIPPELPMPKAKSTFQTLDDLPAGSKVLLSWDFDPATEGELGPMANTFIRQCAQKGHKMYFMALVPVGAQMIRSTTSDVIGAYYPDLVYGEDWVDLGYKAGNEAVVKTLVTDFNQMFPSDARGEPLSSIPMMRGIKDLTAFDAIVSVTAGYPGCKEWVLFASTPLKIPTLVGCTGVIAPQMYPYYPQQIQGLLQAIKGAAEYELLVNAWVREAQFNQALVRDGIDAVDGDALEALPSTAADVDAWAGDHVGKGLTEAQASAVKALSTDQKAALVSIVDAPEPGIFLEAQKRMGPQLSAHILMLLLIVVGNVTYFATRRRGGGR